MMNWNYGTFYICFVSFNIVSHLNCLLSTAILKSTTKLILIDRQVLNRNPRIIYAEFCWFVYLTGFENFSFFKFHSSLLRCFCIDFALLIYFCCTWLLFRLCSFLNDVECCLESKIFDWSYKLICFVTVTL